VSSHITYEPANGHLEVLSKDTDGREALARIVADSLLQSPITGEKIPLKQYDYQSLAGPRNFDIAGEAVASVKVIELGYLGDNHRSLLVKIWTKDADDIHAAARSLISPQFDFRDHQPQLRKNFDSHKESWGRSRQDNFSNFARRQQVQHQNQAREGSRAL
jgi:hypothetical protein